ncbi:MAG: hypothetical protein R3213_04810, partial [Flavobacteriaceae bacterium]|nr:hypothetical protein [Flavobacteriaceae bacterium]
KDENNNYTFEQKSDKIGFHEGFITVPTDSFYPITIFKEELDPKVLAPRQAAGQKISFGFEGGYEDIDIELSTDLPQGFEHRITKERLKDTLFYWYKPEFEIDTTMFYVRNKTFRDTLKHRFQKLEKDSLILSPSTTGAIEFGKDFSISANVPLQESLQQPIKIIRKDSTEVQFTTQYDSILNNLSLKFEKEESEIYNIKILPGTFTDFFGNQNNDTLNYTLRTRAYSDYSNIRAIITNASYPIIVQLTDGKDEVKYEKTSDKFEPIDFRYLNTGTYNMRVILDRNGNGQWDSGNYSKGIKPEPIIYYPRTIEARANFDNIEEFNLQQSGPDLPEN